jgi:ribonucleoside-diphosphate reductase alpha chain
MDMRTNDRKWLAMKLDALARTPGEYPFEIPFPPGGEMRLVPGVVAGVAQLIRYRCERLDALPRDQEATLDLGGASPSPVIDAMFTVGEPRTGTDGTLSWTVDVQNPGTGEDFVLGLKEITLPEGVTRPYAMWLAGNYPRALDGLARILSLDMRVLDPAWIGMKLRKLLNYSEPLGDFMAFLPGERRQVTWPSTVAYMARLIIHRYAMLGILDEHGVPRQTMGILAAPRKDIEPQIMRGEICSECSNPAVIRKDGCDFCTACGAVGACG